MGPWCTLSQLRAPLPFPGLLLLFFFDHTPHPPLSFPIIYHSDVSAHVRRWCRATCYRLGERRHGRFPFSFAPPPSIWSAPAIDSSKHSPHTTLASHPFFSMAASSPTTRQSVWQFGMTARDGPPSLSNERYGCHGALIRSTSVRCQSLPGTVARNRCFVGARLAVRDFLA